MKTFLVVDVSRKKLGGQQAIVENRTNLALKNTRAFQAKLSLRVVNTKKVKTNQILHFKQ